MKTALFILFYFSIGFGVSFGITCCWPMAVLALLFWAIRKLLVKMLAKIEKDVNGDESDESICDGDSCPITYSADEFFSAERGDGR